MAEDAAVVKDDSSGKPHAGYRRPRCRARALRCPRCAGPMFESDKSTQTGREMRTFSCGLCGEMVDVDVGNALWAAMSEGSSGEPEPVPSSARQRPAGWAFLVAAAFFAALTGLLVFADDVGIAIAFGLSATALGAGGAWLARSPRRTARRVNREGPNGP